MSQSFKKTEDLMKNRHLNELGIYRTNCITSNDVIDTGENSNIIDKYENDSDLGRMKARRTYFTAQQREALEHAFSTSQYINPKLRDELASSLGVSDKVVQTWFKNRRVKWRREHRTQFKVFVEPPRPMAQSLVFMPHIAYVPLNYGGHLPYEQMGTSSTSNCSYENRHFH